MEAANAELAAEVTALAASLEEATSAAATAAVASTAAATAAAADATAAAATAVEATEAKADVVKLNKELKTALGAPKLLQREAEGRGLHSSRFQLNLGRF